MVFPCPRQIRFALGVIILGLIWPSAFAVQPGCSTQLFGSDNDSDQMLLIDPSTGLATVLAPFDFGVVASSALAFAPDGVLWGAFRNETGDFLVTVNTSTGAVTPRVQLDHVFEGRGIEFTPDGRLFLVEDTRSYYELDPVTGESTFIASLAFHALGLASSDSPDLFYTVDLIRDALVELDLAGNTLEIGLLGLSFQNNVISLANCPDSPRKLFGVDGRNDLLLVIDPDTGTAEVVGGFGLPQASSVGGLAFAPLPDPLRITPEEDGAAAGPEGGGFSPSSFTYFINNTDESSVEYRVASNVDWLTINGMSSAAAVTGVLSPADELEITLAINSAAAGLPPGPHVGQVSFENLTSGSTAATRRITLMVSDNMLPVAVASAAPIIECSSPSGAEVSLDGTGSFDPDATGEGSGIVLYEWFEGFGQPAEVDLGQEGILSVHLALGVHEITLRVTDLGGATSQASLVVEVVDTTPPVLSVALSPDILWPPNHRLVDVDAVLSGADLCGDTGFTLEAIGSDEDEDAPGTGDGRTAPDVDDALLGADDRTYRLRAERDGTGQGREYTVTYSARDAAGNVNTASAVVRVPLSLSGKTEPVMLGLAGGSSGTELKWTPVPEATSYVVIRGPLHLLMETDLAIGLEDAACLAKLPAVEEPGFLDASPAMAPGTIEYYLVGYETESGFAGFGTESAAKPRYMAPGACADR